MVVLLVAIAAVVAVIFHLVSNYQEERNTRFSRLAKALPVQGLKTVVVAWQILTQVSVFLGYSYGSVALVLLHP